MSLFPENTKIFIQTMYCIIPYLVAIVVVPLMLFFPRSASAQGFTSVIDLTPNAVVNNTAEKPQSKVWNYDGKWWAVFAIESGTHIWRLDGTSWRPAIKISSSTSVEADCKVLGNVCHIFLWRKPNNASQLVSVEYNPLSGTYDLWSTRTSTVFVHLDSGSETGTIDIDTKGRMWLASDGVDDIRVRWSDPPYATWSDPFIVATGVTDDDIGAIIALPALGQIGVLWSDQYSKRFGFKTHIDGAPSSAWSADEVPASQSALDVGNGMADDHLNMAAGADGTLYCAVKTGYDSPGYPLIALLKRLPSGTWDPLYEVSSSGTRGIVILNEATSKLRVIYTSKEDGGDILYRESPTSAISFTGPFTLIAGKYNNVTSAKNNYDPNIVILASDDANLVGVRASDMPPVSVEQSFPQPGKFVTSVYPNPAVDIISLEFEEAPGPGLCIWISDATGKIYPCHAFDRDGYKAEINLGKLNIKPGQYFLMIAYERKFEAVRFLKK